MTSPGEIIYRTRKNLNMTQDEYGSQFGVSGPAVFKFEKDYVSPSLDLWLKMAEQAEIPQRKAVILWAKSRLPREYRDYLDLQTAYGSGIRKRSGRKRDYSKLKDREAFLAGMQDDEDIPSGLMELVTDDELWALYKPTGGEINLLRDVFAPLGKGSKALYREALEVVREFRGV